MSLLHAVAVRFQIVHEFPQILGREIFLRDDHSGRVGGQADRLEIALGIVSHTRRENRRRDVRSHTAGEQRIAVGLRRCYARAADSTAGAANVLDHHGLAEDLPHLVGDDARHDVARAPGGEGHHHRDGA